MNTYRTWESIRAERVANGLIDEDRLAELSEKMHAEVLAHRLVESIDESPSRIPWPERAGPDGLVGEG